MAYLSKGENNLPCARRSRVLLTNCLGGNADGEVIFKHWLTYYFENGRANQSMSIEQKARLSLCYRNYLLILSRSNCTVLMYTVRRYVF